jgi:cyclin T
MGPVIELVPTSSATDKHQIKPTPSPTPVDKHQIKQILTPIDRHQIKPNSTLIPTPMNK